VSNDAIIKGKAAFFAPEIGIAPDNASPPLILIRSIPALSLLPLAAGRGLAGARSDAAPGPGLRPAPLQVLAQRGGEPLGPLVTRLRRLILPRHAPV
jgi:hypothetical protein